MINPLPFCSLTDTNLHILILDVFNSNGCYASQIPASQVLQQLQIDSVM